METLIAKIQGADPVAIAFLVAAFSVLATFYSFYFQYRIWNWPFVWGELNRSEVKSGGGSSPSDRNLLADVEYTYQVDEQTYTGTRLSAMAISSNSAGLIKHQMSGSEKDGEGKVKVYYDPARPHKAFLIRGSKVQVVLTLLYTLGAFAVAWKCAERMQLW